MATCRTILDHGTDDLGQEVRPHWPDGTPAHTYNAFGIVNRYNLQEEFPAVTLRKTYLKSAMDEILWIYQRKSNNVHDLNSHVWDEWADEKGSIGKAYGYQMSVRHPVGGITVDGLKKAFPGITAVESGRRSWYILAADAEETQGMYTEDFRRFVEEKAIAEQQKGTGEWFMDQINYVIYQLVNDPFSRRIMTTLWNPEELTDMALAPCAYSVTFRVTEKYGTRYLNAVLNQRSNDMLAAGAWNVAQYALLVMMLAQVCDMKPGELVHVIADAHIYDRHVPMIKELLKREPKPAPKVWLDPEVKDFYEFTTDNLHVEDYEVGGPQIKDIPIAI